jgi:hypothetical protein
VLLTGSVGLALRGRDSLGVLHSAAPALPRRGNDPMESWRFLLLVQVSMSYII